jgi:hypothetical protein
MHKFTDKAAHTWEVDIDFVTVDRLRTNTPYDLLDHAKVIGLADNSVEVYKLLWQIVEEQAAKINVTPLEFAKLLKPVFKEARDALLKEIVDFFQSCQCPDKALAVDEMRQTILMVAEGFEKEAATKMAAIRGKCNDLVQTRLSSTFGDLGESLDKMLAARAAPGGSSSTRRKAPGSASRSK